MLKLTNSIITVLQTYISMVVSKERFVTATCPVIKKKMTLGAHMDLCKNIL